MRVFISLHVYLLFYTFIHFFIGVLMNVFVYCFISLYVALCVHLCIYVFVCGCIYVFMEIHKCVFMFLCFCVNPLVSLSFPFVIDGYVHMSLFARSFRPHRQDAILSFHSSLCYIAMRHKRVIVARQIIHAQYTLLAHPATIRQVSISQHLRSL